MVWSTNHRALCHQVWTPQPLPHLPGTYYAFPPWVLWREMEGSKAHPPSLPWRALWAGLVQMLETPAPVREQE